MKNAFAKRIAHLRNIKNVSARNMSLELGQNSGYINSIENKKSLPSLEVFFDICDYFDITPKEFFDNEIRYPECSKFNRVISDLKRLDCRSFESVANIIEILADKGD